MFKNNIATILLSLVFCLLVLYIVIYPSEAFKAALDGLLLWFNVVLPALLPFFICVEILIGLGIVSFLGCCFRALMRPLFRIPGEGSFTFFMSIASGYPVGAKITASLLEKNLCSQVEAQRMLSLCSTSGPLFIIGAVATGILGNPKLGLLLASAHYLSALSAGLLMRFWGNGRDASTKIKSSRIVFNPIKEMLNYRKKDGRSFGMLMGDAVRNGMSMILLIGGFIILFSVIAAILKTSGILLAFSRFLCRMLPFFNLKPEAVSSLIIGILEVTNGIKESASVEISLMSKLMMVSFMIGFGGLSINAQVLSVIARTNLNFGLYLMVKVFQGFAAAIYTYFLFNLMGVQQAFNVYDALNVSQYVRYLNSSFIDKIADSTLNLLFILALMLLFALSSRIKRAKA